MVKKIIALFFISAVSLVLFAEEACRFYDNYDIQGISVSVQSKKEKDVYKHTITVTSNKAEFKIVEFKIDGKQVKVKDLDRSPINVMVEAFGKVSFIYTSTEKLEASQIRIKGICCK